MITKEHPYYFLEELFSKEESIFYLSKYVYEPDSLKDAREEISIRNSELNIDKIIELINSLESNQELALHSKVVVKGKTFHIPMIDFATENILSRDVVIRLKRFLPKKIFENIGYFNSGRSLHAYSNVLLSPKEWINFMGRLLLINEKEYKEVVDSRWVGHRLIGGYSSLRWSRNTSQYKKTPTRIYNINILDNKPETNIVTSNGQ